jgi:hypothetical protein
MDCPSQISTNPFGDILATGSAFTVTTVAVLVEEHVEAFVTVTVYDPLVVAVYEALVAPLIIEALLYH